MDRRKIIDLFRIAEEIQGSQKVKYVTPQFYTAGETQKLINGLLPAPRPDTDWQPWLKFWWKMPSLWHPPRLRGAEATSRALR